jgi:phosphoribosylformylglycinamidine (FGAM) synthase PurS component
MIARVTVSPRAGHPDVRGPAAARQAQSLGLQGLDSVNVEDLYFLGGAALTALDAEAIAARLLVDPVVQSFTVEVVATMWRSVRTWSAACSSRSRPFPA